MSISFQRLYKTSKDHVLKNSRTISFFNFAMYLQTPKILKKRATRNNTDNSSKKIKNENMKYKSKQ